MQSVDNKNPFLPTDYLPNNSLPFPVSPSMVSLPLGVSSTPPFSLIPQQVPSCPTTGRDSEFPSNINLVSIRPAPLLPYGLTPLLKKASVCNSCLHPECHGG